jgi:hypothetical protein
MRTRCGAKKPRSSRRSLEAALSIVEECGPKQVSKTPRPGSIQLNGASFLENA